jgi:hypothetical protein
MALEYRSLKEGRRFDGEQPECDSTPCIKILGYKL